jgi:hypothetical protein
VIPGGYDYSSGLLALEQSTHLQPDHHHGWGVEDTGNVDQSCLGRRLLLRLSSRCLFSGNSGWFCAPLSNRGLARHLRQELFHGGGWATTTPYWLPYHIPITFVTLLNGVGRWHLLQARELRRQHATSRHKYLTTLVKTAYLLGRGLCDLQLLDHALAGHIARLPWRRGQTSLQASRRIPNERNVRQSRSAESRPQLEALLQRLFIVILLGRVFDDNCVVSFLL